MSKRTTKHTIEERHDAVTKYLSGRYSRTAISKEYGIGKNTLSNWIQKYKANGIDGLKESQMWKRYSPTRKSILGSESSKKMGKLPFKISEGRALRIVNLKRYPKLNASNWKSYA